MHKPIQLKDLGLSFSHKLCFSDFNEQILYGSRIAIIGRNGIGKSTLLKIIQGTWRTYDGSIIIPDDVKLGYLPQIIDTFETQSGGERLNRLLTEALCQDPNFLLLDEPINHLDRNNRRSLMNHLSHYRGTLMMVTHDVEVLRCLVDTIWHIQQGAVHVFHGSYDDYQRELAIQQASIEQALSGLKRQKQNTHQALMKEQLRAKNSRIGGQKKIENRKWPTVGSVVKMARANETSNRKKSEINSKRQILIEQMSSLRQPELIEPKFALNATVRHQAMVSIRQGQVSYAANQPILSDLNLNIGGMDRIALLGNNGSGKSTLIKAILADAALLKEGEWDTPHRYDIGYLDQHYTTLAPDKTVFNVIKDALSQTTDLEVRKHLNDFLFRKNEEVQATVSTLSGGEKARLSLAQIAAKSPKLLILDEMTNNIDLETRAHVIQVLKAYKGALIVISHDDDFLRAIDIETFYGFQNGKIEWMPSFEEII